MLFRLGEIFGTEKIKIEETNDAECFVQRTKQLDEIRCARVEGAHKFCSKAENASYVYAMYAPYQSKVCA